MASPPLLTTTSSDNLLELRPSGSWTAANVTTLEALSSAAVAQFGKSKTVKLDIAEVRELDTVGAWLLEKISRRAAAAARGAEMVGIADRYVGLIADIRQVNRHNAAPSTPLNPFVAKATSAAPQSGRSMMSLYSCKCSALLS